MEGPFSSSNLESARSRDGYERVGQGQGIFRFELGVVEALVTMDKARFWESVKCVDQLSA